MSNRIGPVEILSIEPRIVLAVDKVGTSIVVLHEGTQGPKYDSLFHYSMGVCDIITHIASTFSCEPNDVISFIEKYFTSSKSPH